MKKTLRVTYGDSDQYELPRAVIMSSKRLAKKGVHVKVTPLELVEQMRKADEALNGDSNDAEHNALFLLREWLSQVYEDSERRCS